MTWGVVMVHSGRWEIAVLPNTDAQSPSSSFHRVMWPSRQRAIAVDESRCGNRRGRYRRSSVPIWPRDRHASHGSPEESVHDQFHAEHIVNLHTKLPLRNLLRAVIVEVRIRQRRGEILIAVVWGDVEFPIGSERVEKHIVIGRQTISINDRAAGKSHCIDFIILVRVKYLRPLVRCVVT